MVNQLGIYDSYAGMILPLLADAAGVFIMKNFFESIPALAAGSLGQGTQYPLKLAAALLHDDPGGVAVLRIPAADHGHRRGRGEGVRLSG